MDEWETRDQPLGAAPSIVTRHAKLIVEGDCGRREYLMKGGSCAVGTDPDSDVVLKDPYVSRRHFRIDQAPSGGYRLTDRGSRNSTFVNGQWTQEAALPFGTTIHAGRTEMRFVPVEEPVALEPSEKESLGELVGSSREMRRIFTLLERIAPSETSVLFLGETGVGKELAARAIHDASLRRKAPFVIVDCSALHGELVESALFGHQRGSFTGAEDTRIGAFEQAAGGTVFLDEIGELPLERQTVLLRVLESRHFQRLGSNEYREADFRIVASTNRDLRVEIAKGRFREDLYYRLAVFEVRLPPLAHRLPDLPLLCRTLLERGGSDATIADEAIDVLKGHSWPGNIRELRNVLQRACVLAGPEEIRAEHLLLSTEPTLASSPGRRMPALPAQSLEELEKIAIEQAVARHGGHLATVAKALGIARSTLYEKLRRHGIERVRGRRVPQNTIAEPGHRRTPSTG